MKNILLYSQYQKIKDLSLGYKLFTHIWLTPFYWREVEPPVCIPCDELLFFLLPKAKSQWFLLKIKIDFFPKVIYDTPFYWRESCLFSKLNDCINWKIFYCTRSTRRKEISLSTTYYSFLYGSLRFIKGRGRTACMHPMWRVAFFSSSQS